MSAIPAFPISAFGKRFIFVTGKGGVGKTLVSATAARRSARARQRTLWVEMTESPRGGQLVSEFEPRYEIAPIEENLWGMNLRIQPAIEEYLAIFFKIPLLSRLMTRNTLFQVLTAAIPGLDSLIPLGKIWYELGRKRRGKPYWDRIVLDAPSTGHALAMLRLPGTVLGLLQSGNLAERTHEIDEVLSNRDLTSLVVVTTLEELPVDESVELVTEVHEKTPYRVDSIICNAVLPDIGMTDRSRYEQWLAGGSDDGLTRALGAAQPGLQRHLARLDARRQNQKALLPRLEQLAVPIHHVPWVPDGNDRQRFETLSAGPETS
jgi:anion-transporting  ArsA/GET3 family ATPase